jgi:cyclophilin family peptidyl-prolyl cis-trans isomerase
MRILVAILALGAIPAFAQDDPAAIRRVRDDKIEIILRIQDRRSVHDGKLVSLLSDGDALVRRRAYLAYGSIQDSTALSLLVRGLTDSDIQVQEAAAFAIGQTGAGLSLSRRAELEHDLLWNRVPTTQVPDQLIEEIGRFGTAEGLQDLVIRVGNVYPRRFEGGMTMAIARFAIRGITDPGAVRYLIAGLKTTDPVAWQAVYALQRIGDHAETRAELEHLVLLRQNQDPLVRMNLATLLGKVRETRVAKEPLIRLASTDSDWRVRVAALRSLAGYPVASDPEVLDVYRRAFSDGNVHVALTAIAALRSSDISSADTSGNAREVLLQLGRMVTNPDNAYAWQYQAEAANTLAALLRSGAFRYFASFAWPNPNLHADMLRALGSTGAAEASTPLLASLDDESAITRCGALEGLSTLASLRPADRDLRKTTRAALPGMCENDDVAVVATAAGMLADSLFADQQSATVLLGLLTRLRGPDDIEALLEVIKGLGTLGDNRAVPQMIELLGQSERSIASPVASALRQLTGTDYAGRIVDREPFFTDFDFSYLRSLPDTIPVTISTARGEIAAELYKELAPFTIMSMLKLSAQRGYFRGLTFHRVVPNFVIQGGCPRGDGWGGPGYTLRSEFSTARYFTGTIGIASAGKDTEGSQFFITHSPQPHLDGRYTIIGRVTDGQQIVDSIQRDDRLFDFKTKQ